MSQHLDRQQLGATAEALAAHYLCHDLGWTILARNWRCARLGELDLVAWDQKTMVFVEVKSRLYARFGAPENNVSPRKQGTIIALADAFLHRDPSAVFEGEVRFDIIAITFQPYELRHFRDAFFPSW